MGEINQSFMAGWREAGSLVLDSVTADYTGHPCSYSPIPDRPVG